MAKPVLGRGLSGLLGSGGAPPKPVAAVPIVSAPTEVVASSERVQKVPVAKVHSSSFQPRKDFSAESLRELADSIKEQGIVQPLIVRPRGSDFELIAGERRWRAAQMVGLAEVPVIVREADDREVLELALIENLQRENLNPIEEAMGYSQLIGQFQLTQEQAAAKVGKSRAVVANALRLLNLPAELQSYVRDNRLSVGHAKVILGLSSTDHQQLAAERVLRKSLNVRQTEELVSFLQKKPPAKNGTAAAAPAMAGSEAQVAHLQEQLQQRFGTKVNVRYRKGKGAIEIKFFTDDDFERILKIAGVNLD